MNYYCVACKVSKEENVINDIKLYLTKILGIKSIVEIIFPTKQYRVKKGNKKEKITKPLTPGYLFIKSEIELDRFSREFRSINDCYGLVQSKRNDEKEKNVIFKLQKEDLEYASWIFSNKGNITPSKITLEIGQFVNVISGPLATFNGKIIKVDKRNNKVCIYSENSGTLQKVWVPVEIVKKEDLNENDFILKEFSKVY